MLIEMSGQYLVYFFHGMTTFFFTYNTYLLLKIKGRTRLQTLLCVIFIFWTLSTILDFFFYTEFSKNEQLSTLIRMFDTMIVPICSFFVLELVSPKWFTHKRGVNILFPFLLIIIVYIVFPTTWYYAAFLIYTILFSIVFFVIIAFATKRYNKYILKNYSYNENIDIKWILIVSILLFMILMIWVITSYHVTYFGNCFYYISSTLLWILIIHRANKHVNIFVPNNLNVSHLLNLEIEENSKEPITIDDSLNFEEQLKTVFEEKQLYLNSKLTITDAARAIGTNRTYLSSYLNNELKMTFYDFVNSMRIEMKAKPLLKEKVRNFTIEEIAQASGFNSVSTFHRAFLKQTGKTPNDFRKSSDK